MNNYKYSQAKKETYEKYSRICCVCGQYIRDNETVHHLAGRMGSLLYNVEYMRPCHMHCHVMEKSLSIGERRRFQQLVKMHVGEDVYNKAERIKRGLEWPNKSSALKK